MYCSNCGTELAETATFCRSCAMPVPRQRAATAVGADQLPGKTSHDDASYQTLDDAGQMPQVIGRYRIIRKLGEGGMAAVYLAHDTKFDGPVALKVPHLTRSHDKRVLERFQREARALFGVRHPGICPVHDVGEIDGWHYISMAYIDGQSLASLRKPVSQRTAARIVQQIANALDAAHQKRIIHRDLKPSNVIIDERGIPVVVDFGLALRDLKDERMTRAGALLGTPAYMPLEQAKGEWNKVGPHTDVYSLGVILYELLTGALPFEGPPTAVLMQIISAEPSPPSEHNRRIDPKLEALCLKAVAKRIEHRYASMAELREALEQYLAPSAQPADSRALARRRRRVEVAERPRPSRTRNAIAYVVSLCGKGSATIRSRISSLARRHGTASRKRSIAISCLLFLVLGASLFLPWLLRQPPTEPRHVEDQERLADARSVETASGARPDSRIRAARSGSESISLSLIESKVLEARALTVCQEVYAAGDLPPVEDLTVRAGQAALAVPGVSAVAPVGARPTPKTETSRYVAVCGLFFLCAGSQHDIIDFLVERQEYDPTRQQWGDWMPLDIDFALKVLASADDFDAPMVKAELHNSVITMPLPVRTDNGWGQEVCHPSLRGCLLQDGERPLELVWIGCLRDLVRRQQSATPPELGVVTGGFERVQSDVREVCRILKERLTLEEIWHAVVRSAGDKVTEDQAQFLRSRVESFFVHTPGPLLFRYLDFSAERGKTYRYRVQLLLGTENGRVRATPWSEPSAPISVP